MASAAAPSRRGAFSTVYPRTVNNPGRPRPKGRVHACASRLVRLHELRPRHRPGARLHRQQRVGERRQVQPAPPRVQQPHPVQEGLPDPRRDPLRRDRQRLRVRGRAVRHLRPRRSGEAAVGEGQDHRDQRLRPARRRGSRLPRRRDLLPRPRRRGGAEALHADPAGDGDGGAVRLRPGGAPRPRADGAAAADGPP